MARIPFGEKPAPFARPSGLQVAAVFKLKRRVFVLKPATSVSNEVETDARRRFLGVEMTGDRLHNLFLQGVSQEATSQPESSSG